MIAPPAKAETRVALTYEVPPGCPPETEFVSSVETRGGKFEGAVAAAHARSLEVKIRPGRQGFEGSLRVEDAAGASALREVHAAECSEVVNGLALVAAIALGGEPSNEAAPAQPAVEPHETGTPAPVSSEPAAPAHMTQQADPRIPEQVPRRATEFLRRYPKDPHAGRIGAIAGE